MNKLKLIPITGLIIVATIILQACGNQNENDIVEETTDQTEPEQKNENIFYALPSPLQLGKILQRAGAAFDKTLLNKTENVANYTTTSAKALNLGVYGADLSYAAIFDQSQEIINYLNASKKLADELGASSVYSADIVKRIEVNSGKRDSILPLLGEILLNSNEAFKENEQKNIAALVAAGGFIEGLYIGTKVIEKAKDKDPIIQRIAELKGSLDNMIQILENHKNNEDITDIMYDLKAILSIYNESETQQIATEVISDTTTKTATIGGGVNYSLNDEQFKKISELAHALRNKIVNK
ncbi:MAG: hypothetical protein ACK4IK_07570 [Bacteroidia bacterium]